jgi:RNA polymerase sigma-70 factor (ECF subfamily)
VSGADSSSASAAELAAAFVDAANLPAIPAGLDAALEQAIASARAARPTIVVSPLEFAAALGAAVGDAEDPVAAIPSVHAGDLWLATACAAEDRTAIGELDRTLATLRPTLAKMGASRETVDELLQEICTRLLVAAPDRPARIRGYRGRSDLRSWLKVAAVRDAVRMLRRERTPNDPDELDVLMDSSSDPELQALADEYRVAFRAAFSLALSELPARDRNLLRYHLLDELTIDDIGAIHRVHRATAARWLVRIREHLYVATRSEIMRSLALSPHEIDSMLRLIRSRLDASVARGLAE